MSLPNTKKAGSLPANTPAYTLLGKQAAGVWYARFSGFRGPLSNKKKVRCVLQYTPD
jgi:hypothetical protein